VAEVIPDFVQELEMQPECLDWVHPLLLPENIGFVGNGPFGIAFHKVTGAAKNQFTSNSSNLEPLFKTKKLIICALDSDDIYEKILEKATEHNVAILPVKLQGQSMFAGPLFIPGIPAGTVLDLSQESDDGENGAKVHRFDSPRKEAFDSSVKVIMQLATAITLPLLWAAAEVQGEDAILTPIADYDLSDIHSGNALLALENFLNPQIFSNPKTFANIRASLSSCDLVSVNDAFIKPFADAMYSVLDQSKDWALREMTIDDYYGHSHHIDGLETFPSELKTCYLIFNSTSAAKIIQDLSKVPSISSLSLASSWYMAGDYLFPHTDYILSREVAFVWNLTKNWQRRWGGGFFWFGTLSWVLPSFNTLNLFRVTNRSYHLVGNVLPTSQGKRLSINGWWHSKENGDFKARSGIKITTLDPEGKVVSHSKFTGDSEEE